MYAAEVRGQRLNFDAEAVWRRNMIIRDRETGTLWQHATGEALIGPLAGERLALLGGERMTWGSWRAQHPQTLVVEGPEKWPGIVPLPITEKILERATRSGFVPGLTTKDQRLAQNEEIVGLEQAGEARAYPLSAIIQTGIINDVWAGTAVTLLYIADADNVRAFTRPDVADPLILEGVELLSSTGDGRWDLSGNSLSPNGNPLSPLAVSRQWWSAWYEFHPETSLYAAAEKEHR